MILQPSVTGDSFLDSSLEKMITSYSATAKSLFYTRYTGPTHKSTDCALRYATRAAAEVGRCMHAYILVRRSPTARATTKRKLEKMTRLCAELTCREGGASLGMPRLRPRFRLC